MQISRYTAAWLCFLTFSLLPSSAAEWQTVDVAGIVYYDIAAGPASDVYAVGQSGDGPYLARLRRSVDSGRTWQDIPPNPAGSFSSFNRVAVDPQGQLFLLGTFSSGQVTLNQIGRSPAGSAGASLTLAHAFDSSYSHARHRGGLSR